MLRMALGWGTSMRDDILTAEVMLFAVAVYDAVKKADPILPSLVIMETVTRVDFKTDDIPSQVYQIVNELTQVDE